MDIFSDPRRQVLDHPRLVPALVVAVSLAALGIALAAEHWGGLAPCALCLYQRYGYLGAVVFGLVGLAVADRLRARRAAVVLGALAFLSVAGIAFYHVGVEQLWWRGGAECHAPNLDLDASIESLRQQLLNTKFVPCDEVAWSLFGISMAGYNFFAALGFAGASLWAGLRGAG